jgi:NAD(P)-dependent dehydrogenase (short-subunit alcohol dehydrogenase family)
MLERGYDEWRAYRQSKLAQIMFSFECARRFPEVESVALHPATYMDTKMVRSRVGRPSSTVQEGADATVRLAADLDLEVQGRYFNGLREARPDALAYDEDARKRLWDVSEQLLAR